ncbi:maf protein, putative [Perkinsus marinus ATCC 50983]|uniref:Maf protein, putative n=1 Tax=Perkinsus marinus (strain ATCC 50983 / TXsc) TaxID=423536 RepID=C5KU13_PERM5|nr:maf protein, putative [Perkinsus marinus ATCC 50983]EER12055.1 maf protein, putative [Perkinsus marinus ATCC 50983]|eukprot:XP_002780260.1 maf protein, putative [Perkinsus marinus ATCC 50983]
MGNRAWGVQWALKPTEYVLQTATEKCKEVSSDGHILEKPDDHAHALEMLKALRGKTHEVSTGVCIVCKWSDGTTKKRQFTTTTRVTFAANITDEDLQAYIETEEPMGKAGGYGIQGIGGLLACKVEGCYSNVVGLPVHDTARAIAEILSDGH